MARAPLVRSFMVAGTHAGVGKTLVATAIVQSLRRVGIDAVAMKAVAQGCVRPNGAWYSDEMQRLAAASAFDLPPRALCGHWVAADSAPAQGRSRRSAVSLESIVDTFQVLSTWADAVVVEDSRDLDGAAGGWSDSDSLARELKLPVLLVVGMRSGCVPAALVCVDALADQGLECAGWIANHIEPGWQSDGALRALRQRMAAPCLGSVPWLHDGAAAATATGIDMNRLLLTLAQ